MTSRETTLANWGIEGLLPLRILLFADFPLSLLTANA